MEKMGTLMKFPRINLWAWLAAGFLALPSAAWSQNYLHVNGADIVDSQGRVVRLTGLNWFGFEGPTFCPLGLWVRSMDSMLDQIKSLGYNMLRVPYATQLFDPGSIPNGIDYTLNPELQNLNGLQILDKLVAAAGKRGLKIVLDRHTLNANFTPPLWYTSLYSEARWISDWQMLVQRYLGNDTVIGCDLTNEPHDTATWGSGNESTDWRLAAERAGNAILAVNPHLLIFVEGINYGANLTQVTNYPVQLNVPNQLVYSPHDYPQSVADQPRYHDPSYPANLPGLWDINWGYLAKASIAPLWLGEFGTKYLTLSDQLWLQTLINYLQANRVSFAYWAWNPDSGDTGGILTDDWQTIHSDKQQVLRPVLAPLIPNPLVATFSASGVVDKHTQPFWGEEDVILSGTQDITALTITISVAKTSGVSYYGLYTNGGGDFTSNVTDTGSAIVYTYNLKAGQVINPGTNLTAGAQYNSNGVRATTSDTYQVTMVIGGQAQSTSGTFQP
jgi:aryl-phospho-beta-D-glucosidase BglC (GH1 family)